MPVSTIGVINAALEMTGQNTLVSLHEDSPLAEKARRLWPGCLDEVLRAHFWKCATARARLNRVAEAPAFGYARAFQLPGDFVRLIACEPEEDARLESGMLLSNSAKMAIVYVRRLADPSRADAALRACLSLRLAAMLAFGVSGSAALAQELEAKYRERLREARAFDSMEGAGRRPFVSEWAGAKMG